MPSSQYTRSKGQGLTYTIAYDRNEYFIERDGHLKKSFPDALVAGIGSSEGTAELMLRMAISDIENLYGMDE